MKLALVRKIPVDLFDRRWQQTRVEWALPTKVRWNFNDVAAVAEVHLSKAALVTTILPNTPQRRWKMALDDL